MKTNTHLVAAAITAALLCASVSASAGPGPRDPLPRKPALTPAAERSVGTENPKAGVYVRSTTTARSKALRSRQNSRFYAITVRSRDARS